jgi:hypothetical protein
LALNEGFAMQSATSATRVWLVMVGAAALIQGCASGEGGSVYRQAAGPRDDPRTLERLVQQTEDLTVVDCLLPGRMRKLGSTITWVSRPRPVKQTATDCEILGGQYILFDRANPETALQVWLAAAETGDPVAQTYVGEIHERGLGRPRDPATAAAWYRKAAAQGNPRAELLLGNLYEKGLGVERNPVEALDLYRRAAGLSQDKVVYLSQAVAAARASQARAAQRGADREQAKAQLKAVKAARQAGDQAVRSTQSQVERAKEEVRRGRTTRTLDQQTPAVATQRRLIDQYVAMSAQAESQRIAQDGRQRIESLAGPAVAQQ